MANHNLDKYVEAAMRYIQIEMDEESPFENLRFFGTIPQCVGVIGTGSSVEECTNDTRVALEGWIDVGRRFGDTFPVIDGININL